MRRVMLGATGLEVTPLAYGTWQFGGDWSPVDDQSAVAAISQARSFGINLFAVARTPDHLAETLGALDLTLSQAGLAEIDTIMAAAVPAGGPTPEGMS